jgi:hypothetical protein
MKVTIKVDGTPTGTRVVSSNGADISDQIAGVTFRHGAGEIPTAELQLALVAIEAVDTPARMMGPSGKEVRRIEYADGSTDEFPA